MEFPVADPGKGNDRLGFALFLALAMHSLAIFGVGFSFIKPQPVTNTIEVTLAQHHTDKEIKDAEFIAQANQQGSGDPRQEQTLITTDQLADFAANVLRTTQPFVAPQPQKSAQHLEQRVLSSNQPNRRVVQRQAKKGEQHSATQEREVLPTRLEEFSSLKAQLDIQKQAYSKLPNILRLTASSTKAAAHAAYLKYWVDKVEQIGNHHYPEDARRRKLYGELQLAVTVFPDGSVEGIEILQESAHRILDQAAVETVRLASPFAPFPDTMSRWDKLEIIQTWRYLPGGRLRTQ